MYTTERQNLYALLRYSFSLLILKNIVVLYVTSSKFDNKFNWSQTLNRFWASENAAVVL